MDSLSHNTTGTLLSPPCVLPTCSCHGTQTYPIHHSVPITLHPVHRVPPPEAKDLVPVRGTIGAAGTGSYSCGQDTPRCPALALLQHPV